MHRWSTKGWIVYRELAQPIFWKFPDSECNYSKGPKQFRLGSKIKKSISKLWKTINCSSKKQKLRESDFEKPDNIVFQWFLSKRSQKIPLVGNVIKEKAMTYAKELGYNNFDGSTGWLDQWKKGKWLTTMFIWRYAIYFLKL